MTVESLAGRLLVATPAIGGEIFRRSVVLLIHHDHDGAHGLVLNKPLSVGVERILPGWQEHVCAPGRLFQGGPVGLDTALGLACVPGVGADPMGVHRVVGSLGVVDLDAPPVLIVPEVSDLRIFAGYSGWGAGQLEDEISEGSWYVVPYESRDPFSPNPERLWEEVLRRQPRQLAWVALYPENPSWN